MVKRFARKLTPLILVGALVSVPVSVVSEVAEAPAAEAGSYVWYDANPNSPFTCYVRYQDWRQIQRGTAKVWQCKKWIYTGRNPTIPPV